MGIFNEKGLDYTANNLKLRHWNFKKNRKPMDKFAIAV